MEQPEDLIKLQNAHVTQHTNGHIKSEWKVEANITDERLGVFPKTFTENEIFHILDFVREYELIAFNAGIKLGKETTVKAYTSKVDNANKIINEMREENERLASALEREMFKGLEE